MLHRILAALRRLRLKLVGVALAPDCELGAGLDCRLGPDPARPGIIRADRGCRLNTGVVLHTYGGEIILGQNVFLGPYAVIYGHGGVTIGDDTLVSMHCRILSSNHTVPALDRHIRWEPDSLRHTSIGRDVWLGAGVTVLGGVTIGDGCVIGAGAVVTKDLPPGSIAFGVPAAIRGKRRGSS